jgi:hypothetical protein
MTHCPVDVSEADSNQILMMQDGPTLSTKWTYCPLGSKATLLTVWRHRSDNGRLIVGPDHSSFEGLFRRAHRMLGSLHR